MRKLLVLWMALAFCGGGSPAGAADPASDMRGPMQLVQDGKIDEALAELKGLSLRYEAAPGTDFAMIALTRARVIERALKRDQEIPNRSQLVDDAAKCYGDVIKRGSQSQKWTARNNLAVLLIREKQPAAAVEVFRGANFQNADLAQRFICYYNFGRALELSDRPAEALTQYLSAIKEPPTLDLAVEAASRLIYMDETHAKEAMTLAQILRFKGQFKAATRHLHRGLVKFAATGTAQDLLVELARLYTAENISPEDFGKYEWERGGAEADWTGLAALRTQHEQIAGYIDDLNRAITGDIKPVFNLSQSGFHATPGQPYAAALSRLLKVVADHVPPSQLPRAVGRYWAAWDLDWNNTDAALRLAAILRDRAKDIDPNGELRREFIEHLFIEKGGHYSKPVKTARDWKNIQLIHLALGAIFAAENQWGQPQDAEWNAHTAVFQFSHAVGAEEELKKLDSPNAPYIPSPGVWISAAECYRRFGGNNEAFDLYERAAATYIDIFHDATAAAETLDILKHFTVKPEYQRQIDGLHKRLDAISPMQGNQFFHVDPSLRLSPQQSVRIEQNDRELRQQLADFQKQLVSPSKTNPSESEAQVQSEISKVQEARKQRFESELSSEQRSKLKSNSSSETVKP